MCETNTMAEAPARYGNNYSGVTGWRARASHQTAVSLVVSDLLTQTVQLQLVDLQVGPGNDSVSSEPLETEAAAAGTCLLTASLYAGQRTLHPAALAWEF